MGKTLTFSSEKKIQVAKKREEEKKVQREGRGEREVGDRKLQP